MFYGIFGYVRLYAHEQNCLSLLNLCMERGYSYTNFQYDGDGGIRFDCDSITARRLLSRCQSRGICVAVLKRGGFPYFLWRYRRRVGMTLGLLIGACLLWLSGRFVWDVRVTGNETLTEREVCEILRENGFGVGSYIPALDNNSLENRVMIESDKISWISLYMDGTVASVQIKENILPPEKESRNPANLVATSDGQIELLQLYRGNCLVKIGQAVKKGELLVSGIYESPNAGIRYTRAAGEVLARVEERFRIEIPLTYEQKVYEESRIGAISVEFFEKNLKIFQNSRNQEGQCDIIEDKKDANLFGICELPWSLSVMREMPYHIEEMTRTEEEALTLAYEELERTLGAWSADAQLLRKSISTTVTDTSLVLDCTVTSVKNIAEQVEFEVLP